MNKKGFTLVEILAVIAILGLLAVIISPKVINLISDSENTLSDQQKNQIVEAAKKYMVENSNLLPEEENTYRVTIETLIENGIINKDEIIDPKTKEQLTGYVLVSYDRNYNQYTYQYLDKNTVNFAYEFKFQNQSQEFIVPTKGYYKLEVWGAQGGSSGTYTGGYGAYAKGNIFLNKNDILYVTVGQQGNVPQNGGSSAIGGYNGGGNSYRNSNDNYGVGSGGGATHIAIASGTLNTFSSKQNKLLIAAGGGGGGAYVYYSTSNWYGAFGGHAGGITGGTSSGTSGYYSADYWTPCPGGGQSAVVGNIYGGEGRNAYTATPGVFGIGGYYSNTGSSGSGGGGGYYGGAGCRNFGGGGGSSYIGNTLLSDKIMYCYGCIESTVESTFTINTIGTSELRDTLNCSTGYSNSAISKCAKTKSGYAKITYLGKNLE